MIPPAGSFVADVIPGELQRLRVHPGAVAADVGEHDRIVRRDTLIEHRSVRRRLAERRHIPLPAR